MKKRIKIITISIALVFFVIALNFSPKSKVNRKLREEFKAEFLTYQSNIDFANIELKNNTSTFFDMDILELNSNMLYFDDELEDFTEDLEESLYDHENINDDIII